MVRATQALITRMFYDAEAQGSATVAVIRSAETKRVEDGLDQT